MAEKTGFLLYHENRKQFEMLNNEQAGILIKALFCYSEDGVVPEMPDGKVEMAFSFLMDMLKRNEEAYKRVCARNARNGKKGGRPKKDTESDETQKSEGFLKKPKKANRDSDSDSECEPKQNPERERVCEREHGLPEQTHHTSHTAQKAMPSVLEIMDMARTFGYDWTTEEAEHFLVYNMDKGRKDNWGFAINKWEEQRKNRTCQKEGLSKCETINAYLAVQQRELDRYADDM